MRQVALDLDAEVPEVNVYFAGPKRGRMRSRLVFDTGSGLTQIDVTVLETAGYSVRDAIGIRSIQGAAGGPVEGYVVKVAKLSFLGKELTDVAVLAYDFENFPGIDGLLGWDVIKKLHLDMDGETGLLKVY